jgi:crotonobetainyl-CoA:carnitine CoA-transferase CaiB-like acyl-CoA transferase
MPTTANRRGPLARFKVVDLSRVRSGPTCARQFADWGADVIMIEAPESLNISDGWGSRRHGGDFQNLHRNKRSMTLNLKDPDGTAIFRKLADRADVLIENFRPEVKFRLGIDYETLKQTNPRLVYASISGYGQDGPYAGRPGFDHIAQGMGGMMSVTGEPGRGPMRAGIAVADTSSGNYCAMGIFVALLEREVSGKGQWVQASLLEAMIAMLDFQAARWLVDRKIPAQAGNDHPTGIPTGVFPTADGYINIAASSDPMWERLCNALGADDLLARPEFKTRALRSQNRAQCHAGIAEYTRRRPGREWLDIFDQAGVASGPINNIKEVFEDPQVRHLGVAVPLKHPAAGDIAVVGQPFALSRTPSEIRSVTPERGQHTDEVMHELGYSDGEITDFRRRMVI